MAWLGIPIGISIGVAICTILILVARWLGKDDS